MGKFRASFCVALASLALACCATLSPQAIGPTLGGELFAEDLATFDGMVIGEQHGTREAPDAVYQLIASLDGRTLVAVEQAEEVAGLDCEGTALPQSWTYPDQDGRSSVAIRQMLCELRQLEAQGQITLIYIDDRPVTGRSFYDTAADRIAIATATDEFDRFIAFTGSYHSQNGPEFFPESLRERGLATLSVTVSSPSGTAWGLFDDGARVGEGGSFACPVAFSGTWGWQRYEGEPQQWDRCLILPSTTASPPAHAG